MPSNASTPVWRSGHAQEIFLERLIKSSVGFELGRSTSPRLNCQAFKAPLSPRRGFTFGAVRAAGWFAEPNVLKSDFDTLMGLEARAVTKSETEAERLRAHARRSLELARAIADQEASRALKAYAAELLERADAIERKDED